MVWQVLGPYLVGLLSLLGPIIPGILNPTKGSSISFETRAHWMREAISAVQIAHGTPCPFQAFGAVVVNHTNDHGLGDLICTGANDIARTGNPTLHGEIAAINNCTQILTNPKGKYKLTGSETAEALKSLSLYTTGEPCPMCSTAIRWGGFKECIFASSSDTLTRLGWPQIDIPSAYVFKHSRKLDTETILLGNLLENETDSLFTWQFDKSGHCPGGCHRSSPEHMCERL